jgi:hypothetical protein
VELLEEAACHPSTGEFLETLQGKFKFCTIKPLFVI